MPKKTKPAGAETSGSTRVSSTEPVLLSGGNPQIGKADGNAPAGTARYR